METLVYIMHFQAELCGNNFCGLRVYGRSCNTLEMFRGLNFRCSKNLALFGITNTCIRDSVLGN